MKGASVMNVVLCSKLEIFLWPGTHLMSTTSYMDARNVKRSINLPEYATLKVVGAPWYVGLRHQMAINKHVTSTDLMEIRKSDTDVCTIWDFYDDTGDRWAAVILDKLHKPEPTVMVTLWSFETKGMLLRRNFSIDQLDAALVYARLLA